MIQSLSLSMGNHLIMYEKCTGPRMEGYGIKMLIGKDDFSKYIYDQVYQHICALETDGY